MSIFNCDTLKRLRKEKKVTLPMLSLATGINETNLSHLENGKIKTPRFETVEVLAIYFGVNMETFKKEGSNPA